MFTTNDRIMVFGLIASICLIPLLPCIFNVGFEYSPPKIDLTQTKDLGSTYSSPSNPTTSSSSVTYEDTPNGRIWTVEIQEGIGITASSAASTITHTSMEINIKIPFVENWIAFDIDSLIQSLLYIHREIILVSALLFLFNKHRPLSYALIWALL